MFETSHLCYAIVKSFSTFRSLRTYRANAMFLTHQGIAHLCWSLEVNTRIKQISTAVARQEGQWPVLTDSTQTRSE